MHFLQDHLLSSIIFLPLLTACVAMTYANNEYAGIRGMALFVMVMNFVLSLWMWWRFDPSVVTLQMAESIAWVPAWQLKYAVGVDGLSILLIVMTNFLMPLILLATYHAMAKHIRAYVVCLLLAQTAILGALAAADMLLFYIFWESMLVPVYFLIGIWGGPLRVKTTTTFFLYTMSGSVCMLVAILYNPSEPIALQTQYALFAAFACAFAIKIPLFPWHTWLPDTYVEAPVGATIVLSALMSKVGIYGLLRFAITRYPHAAAYCLPILAIFAVIGLLYGALLAMIQKDLKRMLAYSSFSHMGLIALGVTALSDISLIGSMLHMIAHGISVCGLFLLVGMLSARRAPMPQDSHRSVAMHMNDIGGLAKVMPGFALVLMIFALASIALPGLSGFVGEFLILMGTFTTYQVLAVLALLGVVLSAVYVLTALQRTLFGHLKHPTSMQLHDLSLREYVVLLPLIVVVFLMGVYPKPLIDTIGPTLMHYTQHMIDKDAR